MATFQLFFQLSTYQHSCRFVPVCVMKAYEVGGDSVSLILNLDTRLISYGELYALAALPP